MRDEVYNNWEITETIYNLGNKKLDVDALKMELLSGIVEMTKRRVLENRYGSIMTDKKNMDIILLSGTDLRTNYRKILTYFKQMM